jgi:hypothetical protein
MKGIDPKWAMYLGLLVTIEQAIGHGTVSLTNLVPEAWAPYITSWCNFLAFVGTAIMTYQAAVSAPVPGPAANTPIAPTTVANVLLVAFALSFLLAGGDAAMAQTPLKRPQITGNIVDDTKANLGLGGQSTVASKGLNDILGALDDKLLPDLQYALKIATATDSKVTAPCYQAWIDIIQKRKASVANADGSPVDLPNPRLITDFEKAVELRNALQPDSDFMRMCSPVANMVKQDMVKFIGMVLAGGAGLATLVPGL